MRNLSEKWLIKFRIHKIKAIKQKYNTIEVRIGNIDTYCEPDSRASANIMGRYQFKAPKRRTNISELKPNYDEAKTIHGELSVKGKFETIIRNKNRVIKIKFIVMRGHLDNQRLRGRYTQIKLDMMILEPTRNLQK